MSTIKVNNIENRTGSSITIGGSSTTSLNLASTITGGTLTNTPAFDVTMSSDQSISNATLTKIQFNAVTFDTASAYDSSNYRYTPAVAGEYFVYAAINGYAGGASDMITINLQIRLNGSVKRFSYIEFSNNYAQTCVLNCACSLSLTTTDYLEVFGAIEGVSGGGEVIQGTGNSSTIFGAYRIIGA